MTATAKSSAAPINGTSVKAAVPAVTTDVCYRVRWGHPYPSYWRNPTDNSYWGYPIYYSYSSYPTYYYPGFSYGWWRRQSLAACGSLKPPLANMYLRDFSVPSLLGHLRRFRQEASRVDVRFN